MAGMMQRLLGRITKIHGCEGAVAVRIEKIFYDNIPEMESLFLEIEGRSVPFFLEDYQSLGHETLLLWFEDYKSVEKVREFIGCQVYITEGDNTGLTGEIETDITGFEISTSENGVIGNVKNIAENNGQFLITVVSDSGNEILIPFHEDLIVKINSDQKKIIMSLPEGLTTIN
jgi:16S rRNA processing protein RimM